MCAARGMRALGGAFQECVVPSCRRPPSPTRPPTQPTPPPPPQTHTRTQKPKVQAVLDAMPSASLKPEDEGAQLEAGRTYRTTYMFSATMPAAVERLARKYLRRPVVVNIGSAGRATENVTQRVIMLKDNEKAARCVVWRVWLVVCVCVRVFFGAAGGGGLLVCACVRRTTKTPLNTPSPLCAPHAHNNHHHRCRHHHTQPPPSLSAELELMGEKKIIVFANTKRQVDAVHATCESLGYRVTTLHGGKSQDQREASIKGFKADEFNVLVATDVAGRGIDVPDVALVVNYDMPAGIEAYTHRIGRTGRAGKKGTAITFLTGVLCVLCVLRCAVVPCVAVAWCACGGVCGVCPRPLPGRRHHARARALAPAPSPTSPPPKQPPLHLTRTPKNQAATARSSTTSRSCSRTARRRCRPSSRAARRPSKSPAPCRKSARPCSLRKSEASRWQQGARAVVAAGCWL